MVFTAIAVVVGLLIGIIGGGSLRRLGQRHFQLWPLLPVGIGLQLPLLDRLGFSGLLASYVCLLVFALANVRLVGMALVAIGIGLNIVPIARNHGMPVRPDAVVAARISTPERVRFLRTDHKHHMERADDRIMLLADILPVRPLREVLSFGDVVLAVG